MYKNFIKAMKDKKITFTQIAELLHCQLNTVSDKADGTVTFFAALSSRTSLPWPAYRLCHHDRQ